MMLRSALLALVLAAAPLAAHAESTVMIQGPQVEAKPDGSSRETAVLAGGCFWGIQAVYQHVKGVSVAESGYAGGDKKDANYDRVSSGRTSHAESVKITFDPREVSYGQLLHIYFSVAHDPTQLNRQGPDTGPHYRSEIFPQNERQAKIAKDYIAQLDATKVFKRPIVTKVGSVNTSFYAAEAYHQDYATKHPNQPYIVFNDAPKVENLKNMFPKLWSEKPVLVSDAAKLN
jgi:peptide-methionine (S)-S-oxide reductase